MVFNRRNNKYEKLDTQGFLRLNNVPALLCAVHRGLGLALLPDWSIEPGNTEMVELLSEHKFSANKLGEADVHLLYLQKKYLSPRIRAVIEFLTQSFKR